MNFTITPITEDCYLRTWPLNEKGLFLFTETRPIVKEYSLLFYLFIYLSHQIALFVRQFHHEHAEIRTTLSLPDHQIPSVHV